LPAQGKKMRIGTFGEYVVSADAIRQGTMWTGFYRVRKYDQSFLTSSAFLNETHTEDTYPTREEAENAAFRDGQDFALSRGGKGPALSSRT
jgi:hypothetical protein